MILKPIILPGDSAAGWFGGEPKLPQTVAWPEIDGIPLCFLAQIDLAKLPEPIWSGLGPRSGHLVFFNHPNRCAAKVLHVTGDLVTRSANVPTPDFIWTGDAPTYPYYRNFPVAAIEHSGPMPEPVGWLAGHSPKFPHPFGGDAEPLDLTNPQHRPFDETSLADMLALLSDRIDMRLRQCSIQLDKAPADAARAKLLALQDQAALTRKDFDAATQAVSQPSFDSSAVATFVAQVTALPLPHFQMKRGADNTLVDILPSPMTLGEELCSKSVARTYLGNLDRHLFAVFVKDQSKLPEAQRDRMAQICEFRAAYESGGMSHAPHGFIYTEHGPNSANEVLLELPSSQLVGWRWGDAQALVFLINREALQRGSFDEVRVDITN